MKYLRENPNTSDVSGKFMANLNVVAFAGKQTNAIGLFKEVIQSVEELGAVL